MQYSLTLIIVVWNALVFCLYGLDKLFAKKGMWRISEKSLIVCAILLGGIGAFLGMKVFRHKTKHQKFKIILPLCAVITVLFLVWIKR